MISWTRGAATGTTGGLEEMGVKTAVLIGDYLFAAAYRLLSNACGTDGMERVNFLLREMVAGELAEEMDKFCLISINRYLERIEKKTARFFQVACELGGQSLRLCPARSGSNWGPSVGSWGWPTNCSDDWQDLSGGAQGDGKPVYQDLKNGVLTLPLIFISGQPGFSELLAEVQAEGKVLAKHRRLIRKWLTAGRVEAEVWQRITAYRQRAQERLGGLDLLPMLPPLGLHRPVLRPKSKQKKTSHY